MSAVGSDQRESPSGTIPPSFTQQSPGSSWPPRSAAAGGSRPPAELLERGRGVPPSHTWDAGVEELLVPTDFPAGTSAFLATLTVCSLGRLAAAGEHPEKSLGQRQGATGAHPAPALLHGWSGGSGNSSARSGLCPQCCLESRHFLEEEQSFLAPTPPSLGGNQLLRVSFSAPRVMARGLAGICPCLSSRSR